MNKLSFTKGVCAVALGAVLALGTLPATAFAVATETGPDPDQWNSDPALLLMSTLRSRRSTASP